MCITYKDICSLLRYSERFIAHVNADAKIYRSLRTELQVFICVKTVL